VKVSGGQFGYVSLCSVTEEIALPVWIASGWKIGDSLTAAATIPVDCALHARRNVARQLYAVCAGPVTLPVPSTAADFIYVIVTDADRHPLRILQAGALHQTDPVGAP
jgi:hypothetical protein